MNGKIIDWLQQNLKKARIEQSAEEYFKQATLQAIMFALAAWFVLVLLLDTIIKAIPFAVAMGIIFFAAKMYYPITKKKEIADLVEKDLPFALMSMSVELNLNVPFERAMLDASKEKYGLASKELATVCNEIKEKGSSVQEALLHFSERVESLQLKRCVSQLVSIYEQGGKKNRGAPIKRLARELLAKQRAESKEFAGKLVVFSLMFIAISAIVPALFQSFVIVGSMFLESRFTPIQVLIASAVCFPLLDLGILLYIKNQTPVFLRE